MMLLFDIGFNHGQNGEDLHKYLPHPHDGISFYDVKEFIRALPDEYKQRFTITVWTPDTDPTTDNTVRVLETINADDFNRQFRRCGYNRARVIIESRHDLKYDGDWEGL